MNTPYSTTNVVTGIFATVFSIFFVISFILTSLVCGITSMLTPEGITGFITSDTVTDFIIDSPDIDTMFEDSELSKEALAEVLEGDFGKDLLSSYADGISAELLGTEAKYTYDEKYFEELCIERKDDIMAFLHMFPEAEGLSDEEMEEVFNYFLEEVPTQLSETITQSAESVTTPEDVNIAEIYHIIVKVLPIILTINTIVMLIVCWLLRIKFTYGLLWSGVASVVAGVLSFCPAMAINASAATISQMAEAPFITPILSAVSERMAYISLIPLVIGIALIVARVLITKAMNNKVETDEGCIRD